MTNERCARSSWTAAARFGPCDVVVSALEGPWAPSVCAAWAETSTPMVDATDLTATDPTERLRHHIGAAIQRLWATTYRAIE